MIKEAGTDKLSEKSRETGIDILKGIGMIFVIIGHMASPVYAGSSILAYTYSFHMALFFAVSGYLSYSKKNIDFLNYTKKRAKGLLLPYLIFFIFSFIWTNTIYAISHGTPMFAFPFSWVDMLKAVFLSGGYLEKVPINNFPLWFLPLSFIASLCLFWIIKLSNKFTLPIITVILAFITIPIQTFITGRPAWHINVLPAALFYMLIGYLYHMHKDKISLNKLNNSFAAIILLVIGYIISIYYNGNISQVNTYIYLIGSLISIYGYYIIASESDNKVLEYIGRNSLYYFSVHQLIIIELANIKIENFFINKYQDGIMIYAVQILSVVILTTVLVIALKGISAVILKSRLPLKNNNSNINLAN